MIVRHTTPAIGVQRGDVTSHFKAVSHLPHVLIILDNAYVKQNAVCLAGSDILARHSTTRLGCKCHDEQCQKHTYYLHSVHTLQRYEIIVNKE